MARPPAASISAAASPRLLRTATNDRHRCARERIGKRNLSVDATAATRDEGGLVAQQAGL